MINQNGVLFYKVVLTEKALHLFYKAWWIDLLFLIIILLLPTITYRKFGIKISNLHRVERKKKSAQQRTLLDYT